MTQAPASRFSTLDGLRGMAALMVAFYHFQIFAGVAPIRGYLAVDLFFAISGFVLCHAYQQKFERGFDAGAFFRLRFSRFFPLYACGFIFGGLAVATGALPSNMGVAESLETLVLNGAMLPNPATQLLYPLNGAAWSLFFELLINVALACWLWKARSSILALLVAAGVAGMFAWAKGPEFLNLGWSWDNVSGGAARTLFSFTVGVLIFRFTKGQQAGESRASLWLVASAFLLAVPPLFDGLWWDLAYIGLASPLIVLAAARTEPPQRARPFMEALGRISYAVYAVHWPLCALTLVVVGKLPLAVGAALFLGVTIILAWLLERHVDRPLQRWFKERARTPAATVAGLPA